MIHRAHLHELLHEKVVELGIQVRLRSKVAHYDLDEPRIVLEDGCVIQADFVVAADGEFCYIGLGSKLTCLL